ncbi:MAG TPA: hypothetical protein VGG22_15125 [Candidatus Baltobacteraceae bacterium]|jgi:hypothetical protein
MIANVVKATGNSGLAVLGTAFVVLIFAGPWLVYEVFPLQAYRVTEALGFIAFLVGVVFAIIAIVPRARPTCGAVLIGASYVISLLLWVWSVILVGNAWGIVTLYVVNFFFGVGAIVGAYAATLLGGNWSALGQLVIITIIIFAFRLGGAALTGSE